MKLPNAENAIVELEKLRAYCLNHQHPRGKHKARVFETALGLTADHAEELQKALLAAAVREQAQPGESDNFGMRYVVDFDYNGPAGVATVRSTWIVKRREKCPRLTSCYVK